MTAQQDQNPLNTLDESRLTQAEGADRSGIVFKPWRVISTTVAGLCLVFSLFFWVKLRLVTAVPRTAYAVPESERLSRKAQTPAPRTESPAPSAPVQPVPADTNAPGSMIGD
ncbi:MAG: hypothetical protein SFY95_05260 [Planctomycetota bacterium]|nr:hypothetical protein [Planctomycetota bacterium]